jgi:hypothetical protein
MRLRNRMKRHTITDDERAEFRVRKPKLVRCADRMCGADDCPNCHPENAYGPHVSITERSEKLVCTKCEHLKHNLIRSGRDPQWECLCLHPRSKEVAEAMPGADRCWSTNGSPGCWIGEQPDTPEWCPMRPQNLEQPSASVRRANNVLYDNGAKTKSVNDVDKAT